MRNTVKMTNAALDEKNNQIILRGVLDHNSLELLQVDDYQRETLPLSEITGLIEALRASSVPDIELGMRGGDFHERDGAFYLKDPVFIVDGQQRVNAAKQLLLASAMQVVPRLGATVHFNTNKEWEREKFRILNMERVKLSPNILVRNMRNNNQAVRVMFNLTTQDKNCVLYERVSWDQRAKRKEIVSALTVLKSVGVLHSHLGAGRGCRVTDLSAGVQKIMEKIGPGVFRENIRLFYDIVDQCWSIRTVTYRAGATHLKHTFLKSLAFVFSNHLDFWRENRLFVETELVRKLRLFNIHDPSVANLAGSGGQANKILYQLLVDHINSGKRTRRLKPRVVVESAETGQAEAEEQG